MGIFSILKRKSFFSEEEHGQIVDAIRTAEKQTSGEIRVYIESKNPMINTVERAEQVFYKLKMERTQHRNGVLVYIAIKHKEIALYGDEGIFQLAGEQYWKKGVDNILTDIKSYNLASSIEKAVLSIGSLLKEKFPFEELTDKNELPDEIVFGK